jgi:hypothetical protein
VPIVAAVGIVIAARPGVRAGMPSAWALLSYATALAAVVAAGVWLIWAYGSFPFNLLGMVVVAAVLLPAWGIWLALRANDLRLGPTEVE